ncbi:MAG TPA: type II secretion system protein [Candidatus Paceibacterota bacterium]|nr:type II secretion system protein [Candidatus Paceibacterota bacterium]
MKGMLQQQGTRRVTPARVRAFGGMAPHTREAGFTLVEMLVSIALFSVVMLVCTGSLLALVAANKKAQALHSVMENLNIATDSMVRAVRMGSAYHCGSLGDPSTTRDCTSGDSYFWFEPFNGWPGEEVYYFADDGNGIGRLYRAESTQSGVAANPSTGVPVTSAEVNLTSVQFFVYGSTPQEGTQPKVVIIFKGEANTGNASDPTSQTSFTVQATASQRALDL